MEEKINYQKKLDEIIASLNYRPKLLLHSCCAPCSSYVITYLDEYFDITILYYNPNIEPIDEYVKRKNEQIRLIKELNKDIKMMDIDYLNIEYRNYIKGLENDIEGKERCHKCYYLRLEKTASLAKDNNYDYFATTLTVSPYKNSAIINKLGLELENNYKIKYLVSDFKKNEGYKKSILCSKKYNLYRQNYCGCLFSKNITNE